jgi:aryl-alcohol dehydrogenase-like predicted oxidoreductase
MENLRMDYVRFGSTGLKVSRLCLGCMSYGSPQWRPWVLDEKASRPFFKRAVEAGINFYDTANVYSMGGSEEVTGKLLREFLPRRSDYVLATKVFNRMGEGPNDGGLSRKHIMESVDASLKRLGTDYIDLLQIHRFDNATPIEETIEALSDVVKTGKALYLGASSMYAWQFMKMLETQRRMGAARFVSMQNFYNLIYREEEREMLPLCAAEGIAVIPWSPLARGFLAGTRPEPGAKTTARAQSDDIMDRLGIGSRQDYAIKARVDKAAERLGAKPAVVALAWLLSKPVVTAPIFGATKPHHLDDALAALSLKLDARTIRALEEPYRPREQAGNR